MDFTEENEVFSDNYFELMESCHKIIEKYPLNVTKPSYISLSTMTMVCELTKQVDILSFSENFKSPVNPQCEIKKPKHNSEFELTKRGKKKKTFFNQASIHYKTHTCKCIKVFSNGRLYITGVTSMNEASEVCKFTCNILNNTPGAITGEKNISAHNLRICMINTNFALNNGIDIIKLKNCFVGNESIVCHYTPDTYPGLKIKIHHENKNISSMFIFSSGQIVITGVKLMVDVKDVYINIMSIIFNNIETIYNNDLTQHKKKNKQHVRYQNGYDESNLKACVF